MQRREWGKGRGCVRHLLPQISVCKLTDSWNREQFEIRREQASINPFANAQAKGKERKRKGGRAGVRCQILGCNTLQMALLHKADNFSLIDRI